MNELKKILFFLCLFFMPLSLFANNTNSKISQTKIGILGAMDDEIKDLLTELKEKKETKTGPYTFYEGKLNGKNVVITKSGVGMVAASVATTILANDYDVDYLIFTGVAGSLSKKVNVCDIVISTGLIQYQFDVSAFGHEKGYISGIGKVLLPDDKLVEIAKNINYKNSKIEFGKIISADKFVENLKEKESLGKEFDALAVDMESASFAQVAYLFKKPYIVIRSISDSLSENSIMEYSSFLKKAVKNNKEIVLKIVDKI